MSKYTILDWDATASGNTDLGASLNTSGTGLVSTADDSFREIMAQVSRYNKDLVGLGVTVGGNANAVTLAVNQPWTALADGQVVGWKHTGGPNTGAMTVTVTPSGGSAFATKDLVQNGGAAFVGGEILDNAYVIARYDATLDDYVQINGGGSAAAATTSAAGIVELATTAETETGTDATRAVTPDSLHDMTTLAGAAWFLDEDTMSSNSATKVPSQQSVKAYADTKGITLGTPQASTSGTAITFSSIPSGTKQITVTFSGVSTNATSPIIIQIGDSGGVENTGYAGSAVSIADGATTIGVTALSSGFMVGRNSVAASVWNGSFIMTLESSSAFRWAGQGGLGHSDTAELAWCYGTKALTAELDRVIITTAGGTATFDAGEINIAYSS